MLNTDTLKKNYEFKNVLTKGKYYNGNYIDMVMLPFVELRWMKVILKAYILLCY